MGKSGVKGGRRGLCAFGRWTGFFVVGLVS